MATNPNATIDNLKVAIKEQFKKPKSFAQCVTKLKEICQELNESVWEVDQPLKRTIRDGGFTIDDTQHKEWFIIMMFPHLHQYLNQQKIVTLVEGVEIAKKV